MEMQHAEDSGTGFRHSMMVRYGECDMQGVVFNANYLAYADDVCDHWLFATIGRDWSERFDCVLKKASVEWRSAARHGDIIDFRLVVTRWGNTSFHVGVEGSVDGRPVASISLVYISVAPGSHEPVPVPAAIRDALSAAAGGDFTPAAA
jgi:acyl-CoA thioester hydrolase